MLLQHLLEIPARMAGGMLRYLLRRARHHNLAALIAAFGAQVDHPVAASDHIEVVLDHQEIPEWAWSLRSRKSQKPDSKPLHS